MTKQAPSRFSIVMVVDDCHIDRLVTARVMAQSNFTDNVIEYDPEQALQYLQDHSHDPNFLPEIILLDINMPEISGFQFMEVFDKFPESVRNYCKVYMISSTADPNEIVQARTLKSISGFQAKPITAAFLENIDYYNTNSA